MARRHVKPDQSREHELHAWDLRCRGWTQARIADELGLTQQSVSRILARVNKRSLKELTRRVELLKAEQHARLDHLYSEAMAGWERTKLPVLEVSTRERVRTDGETTHTDRTKTQYVASQVGDVRFLQEARALLKAQCELWGIGREEPGATEAHERPRYVEVMVNDDNAQRSPAALEDEQPTFVEALAAPNEEQPSCTDRW